MEDFLKRSRKTSWHLAVIEFTDQFDTSLMAKSVAFGFRDKLLMGEARGSNHKLAREFGLGSQPAYPQFVALCADNDNKLANIVFQGKRTKKQIDSWLSKQFEGARVNKATCENLKRVGQAAKIKAKEDLRQVLLLSKADLEKKRVKELRSLAEGLDINVAVLKEKPDFVDAILAHSRKDQKVEL